jgi:hypothetical protein
MRDTAGQAGDRHRPGRQRHQMARRGGSDPLKSPQRQHFVFIRLFSRSIGLVASRGCFILGETSCQQVSPIFIMAKKAHPMNNNTTPCRYRRPFSSSNVHIVVRSQNKECDSVGTLITNDLLLRLLLAAIRRCECVKWNIF